VHTVTKPNLDVLKQPLHTKIAIDTLEFTEFSVEDKLHVVISVKDFKAIATHAGITSTTVSAAYSYPFSPMLLKYNDEGMTCEFILMTIGDERDALTAPGLAGSRSGSSRPSARQHLEATSSRSGASAATSMPPPPRSAAPSIAREAAKPRTLGPSPPPPQPSLQSDALFFPEEDDDRRWDPVDEEDEEMLAWDASAEDENSTAPTLNRGLQGRQRQNQSNSDGDNIRSGSTQRLPPTQRVSQVSGHSHLVVLYTLTKLDPRPV
jgi:cell cycle checkpoint control protein RAD9A